MSLDREHPATLMLEEALRYMARGWMVFPVRGKIPVTEYGLHDATTDQDQADAWWPERTERGIGLATGEASGVWVVDLDGEEGRRAFVELQDQHEQLPPTVASRTGNGVHLFFRLPPGQQIRNSASKIAPKVDVRGTGGYVVLPPSPHPSGKRYEWVKGRSLDERGVGYAPMWLVNAATSSRTRATSAVRAGEPIPAGARNDTLASLAGTMRKRGMARAAIAAALHAENIARCAPPLDQDEVEKIADSVARYEPSGTGSNGSASELDEIAPGTDGLPRSIPAIDAEEDELPSFAIEGLVVKNEIHVTAGDGGVGKTSFQLAIAGAVAAECAALDRFATRTTGPVLIISEEDSEGFLRNRLEALCAGHGWPLSQVLARAHLLCLAGVQIDQAHWQRHILAEVERIGAVAVFLDPWFDVLSGEENSNSDARPAIKFLRRLAQEATVFVAAHAGKAVPDKRKIDRIRGASALYSAARVVYFVERDDRGMAVYPLKFSRGELPKRFVVSRTVETDPENGAVWTSARLTYLTAGAAQEVGAEKLVREALARAPGAMTKDLKEYVKGSGITAVEVSQAIRSLENRGVITFDPGPRNSKYWRLCEPAENSGQAGQANLPTLPEPAGQGRDASQEPAPPFRGQAEAGGNLDGAQAEDEPGELSL